MNPMDDEVRIFLGAIQGSSKLAHAMRSIVACKASPDAARAADIQRKVVEHRLAHVEQWLEQDE